MITQVGVATIHVVDVDRTYAELSVKGVEFSQDPVESGPGMKNAMFLDPDGDHFILIELPENLRG